MVIILYLSKIINTVHCLWKRFSVACIDSCSYHLGCMSALTQSTSFISPPLPLGFPLSLHVITLGDHSLHLSSQHVCSLFVHVR